MATVSQQLNPSAGIMRTTAFPALVQANGTNIPVRGLAFDAATEEAVFFRFRALNYGSGNLTVSVYWYADTASSGNVIWGAAIAAITPDTDSQDIETDSLATASTVTDAHLGTTGQRLHQCSITVSNLDSLAANDDVALRFYRDADDGSDTMTGDAILVGLVVSYSDT
jgi:hypothetical protein